MLKPCCILAISLSLSGCAKTVPYNAKLRLAGGPREQVLKQKLVVHMTDEQSKLVVNIKPLDIPGTNSYNFPVGESLKANLTNTLLPLFGSVELSTLDMDQYKGKAAVLDVDLKSYNLHIGPSILDAHSAALVISYALYDEDGKAVNAFTTDTSSTSKMTEEERDTAYKRIFIPFGQHIYSGESYENAIGRVYDEALAKSIYVLITNIEKAWGKEEKIADAARSLSADDRVELKEGYEAGRLELTFAAQDNGSKMEVRVKNLTAKPVTVVVYQGAYEFHWSGLREALSLSVASRRVLKLPASGDASFVLEQSGPERMTSGTITTRISGQQRHLSRTK